MTYLKLWYGQFTSATRLSQTLFRLENGAIMGTWGPGLYSNDFAADLRSAIGAIAKLPFDSNRLVEILRDTEPDVADDSDDEAYTTFWLVAADQFHKRGIKAVGLFEHAKQIIDSEQDLKKSAELGMSESDLRKRSKTLQKLREKIESTVPSKTRRTLSRPQPFTLDLGDLFVFPVSGTGEPINPYMSEMENELVGWRHENWGAGFVVSRGRAFDYLSWYQTVKILTVCPKSQTPDIEKLIHSHWRIAPAGTLSKSHFKKLKIKIVAKLSVSENAVNDQLDTMDGLFQAIDDVSISNSLTISDNKETPDLQGLNSVLRR